MPVRQTYFPLDGGLDLVTPYSQVAPGACLSAKNYELLSNGGYRRMDGALPVSGFPLASSGQYYLIQNAGITVPSGVEYPTATAATPGKLYREGYLPSSGHPYLDVVWVGDGYAAVIVDNDGQLSLPVNGESWVVDWTDSDENSQVETIVWADDPGFLLYGAEGLSILGGYNEVHALCIKNATEAMLNKEQAPVAVDPHVPADNTGIVGVCRVNGRTVALRNVKTLSGERCYLFISDDQWGTGWTPGYEKSPQFGSRHELVVHNFGGHTGTKMVYGCDGSDHAFQLEVADHSTNFADPDFYLSDIITGMTDDRPTHIAAHKGYLFLSFRGGSLQHSPPGDPIGAWSVVIGAGELGIGSEIVGLESLPGGVLAIFCDDKIALLRGSGTQDWSLEVLHDSGGARPGSIQSFPQPYYAGFGGIESLAAVQQFGDFETGILSDRIAPFVVKRLGLITASVVSREKSQYRIFFSDGWGLSATFSAGKLRGWMPFKLPFRVLCAWSGIDEDTGNEIVLVGTDHGEHISAVADGVQSDGRVMQMDVGNSFGSQQIGGYFRTAFGHAGNPRSRKRWRKASIDIRSNTDTTLSVQPEFDSSIKDFDISPITQLEFHAATPDYYTHGGVVVNGAIDESEWGEFYDGAQVISHAELELYGTSVNMSLVFSCDDDQLTPSHTVTGVTLHYSSRALSRSI